MASDVDMFMARGEELDLRLNINKCEIINTINLYLQSDSLKNFIFVMIGESYLLGAPLLAGTAWTASVPFFREPNGLFRSDGRRPDLLTLITWHEGRCLAWDATAVNTLAASYIHASSTAVGSVAEGASERKEAKYSAISQTHFHSARSRYSRGNQQKGVKFLSELANRLTLVTDDPRES